MYFGACDSAFRLLLLLARLLLLQNLLDDLLLLDQEGADDAVPDAVTASRTTVGALDGLLGLGDLGVLAGTESRDLWSDNVSKPVCERKELSNQVLDGMACSTEFGRDVCRR